MSVKQQKDNKAERLNVWGSHEWFLGLAQKNQKSVSSYFSHGTNGYQRFRHKQLTNFLIENLYSNSLNSVIDIGCGTGHLLNLINKTFNLNIALGVDFVHPVIKDAQFCLTKLTFALSKLPDIPVLKDTGDLVIASEVLYYLSSEARRQAVDEIYRILKPGGFLFFTSTLGDKYFTESTAHNLLAEKFDIISVRYLNSRLYKLVILFPYCLERLNETLQQDGSSMSKENSNILENLKRIFNNPVGRPLIRLAAYPCGKLLSSERLPIFFEWIAQRIRLGNHFQGNILILARCKEKSENVDCNSYN